MKIPVVISGVMEVDTNLGIWGGANQPFPTPPIYLPPGYPSNPPGIWGGGNVPMPNPPIANVPGAPGYQPPLGIWGPNDPRPTNPIAGIPGLPGYEPPRPPLGIWGPPGPWPTPPIHLPPDRPNVPSGETGPVYPSQPGVGTVSYYAVYWTPQTGYVLVPVNKPEDSKPEKPEE